MRILVTTAALMLLLGSAGAAELAMPAAGAGAAAVAAPAKGASMAAVRRDFGEPVRKHPPVGGASAAQPPITRWDYPGFSVFFEYDHVVDSVVKGHPALVHNIEALEPG